MRMMNWKRFGRRRFCLKKFSQYSCGENEGEVVQEAVGLRFFGGSLKTQHLQDVMNAKYLVKMFPEGDVVLAGLKFKFSSV